MTTLLLSDFLQHIIAYDCSLTIHMASTEWQMVQVPVSSTSTPPTHLQHVLGQHQGSSDAVPLPSSAHQVGHSDSPSLPPPGAEENPIGHTPSESAFTVVRKVVAAPRSCSDKEECPTSRHTNVLPHHAGSAPGADNPARYHLPGP